MQKSSCSITGPTWLTRLLENSSSKPSGSTVLTPSSAGAGRGLLASNRNGPSTSWRWMARHWAVTFWMICNSRPIGTAFWGEDDAGRPRGDQFECGPWERPVRCSTRFSACGEGFGSAREDRPSSASPWRLRNLATPRLPWPTSTMKPAPWPWAFELAGRTARLSMSIATGRPKTLIFTSGWGLTFSSPVPRCEPVRQ